MGYGDIAPTSWLGRWVACVVMLIGIIILALPIGVVGGNFAEIYRKEGALQSNHFAALDLPTIVCLICIFFWSEIHPTGRSCVACQADYPFVAVPIASQPLLNVRCVWSDRLMWLLVFCSGGHMVEGWCEFTHYGEGQESPIGPLRLHWHWRQRPDWGERAAGSYSGKRGGYFRELVEGDHAWYVVNRDIWISRCRRYLSQIHPQ